MSKTIDFGVFVTEPTKKAELLKERIAEHRQQIGVWEEELGHLEYMIAWNSDKIKLHTNGDLPQATGPYTGLSVLRASIKVLQTNTQKMTGGRIAAEMEKGGFQPLKMKTKLSKYVYTVLFRESHKPNPKVIKYGSEFGLPEWEDPDRTELNPPVLPLQESESD